MLVIGVLVVVVAALVVVSSRRTETVLVVTTPQLPFDMPSAEVLRASPHKVFVNYFTPVPISVDNRPADSDYYSRNFLTPEGENGIHAAYGGVWRDRPMAREPSASPTWRLDDLKAEVRTAISGGIDGFYLDMLQLEGDPDIRVWETTKLMMQAAHEVDPGFEIVLMPDLASPSMRSKSPAVLARYTAELASSPSAYRLADGRLVVMPAAAESHDVSWWRRYMAIMDERYHLPVALVPIFIADEAKFRDQFADISFGMSTWGAANPQWNDPQSTSPTSPRGRAAKIRELGPLWVQPVRVQGERPKQGLFSEAENTGNLRTMWDLARETNADWVQIPTWNDYSEGTQLSPSERHGYTFFDLNTYFLTWYKTGSKPRIVRDMIYLTHRTQPVDARPVFEQSLLMKTRGGSPPRDTVEALTFLTAPAVVEVHVGGVVHQCAAPAGMGICTVPLSPGVVSASAVRGGSTVAQTVSPAAVSEHPYVQDLEYVGSTSGRPNAPQITAKEQAEDGSGASRGDARPVEVEDGDAVERLPATFDTYVNQAAKDRRYAKQGLLASRGSPGYVTYLRFHVPNAPKGKELVGASLRLATGAAGYATSSDDHQVHLDRTHDAGPQTSWSTRPATAGPLLGRFSPPDEKGDTERADLNAEPLAALQDEDVTLVVSSRGKDNWWFASSEAESASRRPTLLLVYR